ncbi:MAG TPA: type II secretion system F family protein [Dehalococcoidia bacterium]|nr:type II secretion system F family protein [Dehalococcoidia bacterium]
MIPVLTSAAAASSVLFLTLWYGLSKNQHDERLRTLLEPQRLIAEQQDPFTQRVAFPVVNGLVGVLMAILPTALIARARVWLIAAGDKLSLSQFLTIVLMTGAGLPAFAFVVVSLVTGGAAMGMMIVAAPILAVVGGFAPFMVLRRLAKNRQKVIWRSMPAALDLLTTCVEAGLSLDFGLQRVAERYAGPFSDEINRALREMGLGKPRREALSDMAERIGVDDLKTFVNSLLQAEALGTSVGQVLRVQASQMRLRRRQKAEQMARQAPVKMVFPLVFFLMPSLFIVTLGPVILNVIKVFSEN